MNLTSLMAIMDLINDNMPYSVIIIAASVLALLMFIVLIIAKRAAIKIQRSSSTPNPTTAI